MKIFASTNLPTEYGEFLFQVFKTDDENKEHVVLTCGDMSNSTGSTTQPLLTRIHCQCMTGETFHSLKCDCEEQLKQAMQMIQKVGRGMIIYLSYEGRGIGLVNKIKAYHLQENGLDTVEANLALGLPADRRQYDSAAAVLKHFGVQKIELLTNNPSKIEALKKLGDFEITRVPLEIAPNSVDKEYLVTKKEKMGHLLKLV